VWPETENVSSANWACEKPEIMIATKTRSSWTRSVIESQTDVMGLLHTERSCDRIGRPHGLTKYKITETCTSTQSSTTMKTISGGFIITDFNAMCEGKEIN